MLLFRSSIAIEIIIPIIIGIEIEFPVALYSPGTVRILCIVVASGLKHIKVLAGIAPHILTLGYAVKLINYGDMVVAGMDKISGCSILTPSEASIIAYIYLSIRILSRLCSNQNHA